MILSTFLAVRRSLMRTNYKLTHLWCRQNCKSEKNGQYKFHDN